MDCGMECYDSSHVVGVGMALGSKFPCPTSPLPCAASGHEAVGTGRCETPPAFFPCFGSSALGTARSPLRTVLIGGAAMLTHSLDTSRCS